MAKKRQKQLQKNYNRLRALVHAQRKKSVDGILIDNDTISFKYDIGLGKKRTVKMSQVALVNKANEALRDIPVATHGGL